MIQKFRARIVTLLRDGLNGVIADPPTHIVEGLPPDKIRPVIGVYGGDAIISEQAMDTRSSKPRPVEMEEIYAIKKASPSGPYALTKRPLEGTSLGQLIFNQGKNNEYRRLILEKKDYSISSNDQNLSLTCDTTGADAVAMKYNFAGVYFIQDFQVDLFTEIVAADSLTAEQLASLTAAVIFTNRDELIDYFNVTGKTVYSANAYLAEMWIGSIAWRENKTKPVNGDLSLIMHYSVNGQIRFGKQDPGDFGIIEKIHSPGTSSEAGDINITPELG